MIREDNLADGGETDVITTDGGPVWYQAVGDFGGGSVGFFVDFLATGQVVDFQEDVQFTADSRLLKRYPQGVRIKAIGNGITDVSVRISQGTGAFVTPPPPPPPEPIGKMYRNGHGKMYRNGQGKLWRKVA